MSCRSGYRVDAGIEQPAQGSGIRVRQGRAGPARRNAAFPTIVYSSTRQHVDLLPADERHERGGRRFGVMQIDGEDPEMWTSRMRSSGDGAGHDEIGQHRDRDESDHRSCPAAEQRREQEREDRHDGEIRRERNQRRGQEMMVDPEHLDAVNAIETATRRPTRGCVPARPRGRRDPLAMRTGGAYAGRPCPPLHRSLHGTVRSASPARNPDRTGQGDHMRSRSLGTTGVKVSPLCLGAMMFGTDGQPGPR